MNRTANVISYVLHPVFMPLAGILILFSSGLYFSEIPTQIRQLILILTALSTILLPLSMLPALIYLRHIESFTLSERRERIIPLFFTTICYYVAHHLLTRFLNGNNIYSIFLLACTGVVLVLLIVSLFWKVSMHTAGIGGIIALVAVLSVKYTIDMTFLLSLCILLSGLLFSARLKLAMHSPGQLIAGFLTGLAIVFGLMTLFLR